MRGEGIKDVAQHFLYVGFLGQGGQLVVGCVQEGGASFRRVGVGGHKMNQLPERLPRAMDPDDLQKLLSTIDDIRDRTMFMLMLRCGLRVEEVANLAIGAIDVNRRTILVEDGKGGKTGSST